jgi:hypothetical protein
MVLPGPGRKDLRALLRERGYVDLIGRFVPADGEIGFENEVYDLIDELDGAVYIPTNAKHVGPEISAIFRKVCPAGAVLDDHQIWIYTERSQFLIFNDTVFMYHLQHRPAVLGWLSGVKISNPSKHKEITDMLFTGKGQLFRLLAVLVNTSRGSSRGRASKGGQESRHTLTPHQVFCRYFIQGGRCDVTYAFLEVRGWVSE